MRNKKKAAAILSLVLTYGCGPGVDFQNKVEEEVKEHLQKFNEAFGMNVNISITYTKLPTTIVGMCYSYTFQPNSIEIDEDKFKRYDYYGRQEVIFHELGHCVLNRGHDDTLISLRGEKIPTSIMYPYVFGSAFYYKENLDYYYKELIRGK